MLEKIKNNQKGLSLAITIALGFAAAVLVIIIVGLIVYFVKA